MSGKQTSYICQFISEDIKCKSRNRFVPFPKNMFHFTYHDIKIKVFMYLNLCTNSVFQFKGK
jgi:hypothetical protein